MGHRQSAARMFAASPNEARKMD